jgi:CRP-like cAMP-binding protein
VKIKKVVIDSIILKLGKVRTLIHVEGSYFGEVDILVSRARGESAIAESAAEVWKVEKDIFLRLLNEFEDVKMEVLDHTIKKVFIEIFILYLTKGEKSKKYCKNYKK